MIAALRRLLRGPACGKRYSTDHDDPGYANWLKCPAVDVYLDGEHLDKCVIADERQGIAVVYEQPYRLQGDELVRIKLRGVVRVVPRVAA